MNLRALQRDGITVIHPLPPYRAAALAAYLQVRPCYPGHVKVYGDGQPREFHQISSESQTWCHDLADVLSAPDFWELVLGTTDAAIAYLGSAAHLYSLNAYWAGPAPATPMHDLQTWHRDKDDERFMALFVYGTAVTDEAAGPHCYRLGTHEGSETGTVRTVLGPPGTAFLEDPRGYHMGEPPTASPRLLLWARWGVSPVPPAYLWDKTVPADRAVLGDRYPRDVDLRERVRLVVN